MNKQYGITCRNLTTSFFDVLDNLDDFGTLDIIRFDMFNDGGFHPHIQEFFPELVPINDTNDYGDNNGAFNCSETASTIAMTRYGNSIDRVNVYAILPFTYYLDNHIGDDRGIPREKYDYYMNSVIGFIYVSDRLEWVLNGNALVTYKTHFTKNDNYTNSNFLAIPLVLYNVVLDDNIIYHFKQNGLLDLIQYIQQSFIDHTPYS